MFLTGLGHSVLFLGRMVRRPERLRVLWHRTLEEVVGMGVESVPLVGLVSVFIGAVTCVQIAYTLTLPFLPKATIGYPVREMTLLELAPTITSMALALLGGYLTGMLTSVVTAHDYVEGLRYAFVLYDLVFALVKSVVFAFLIAAIAGYYGFYTRGGALAVGLAARRPSRGPLSPFCLPILGWPRCCSSPPPARPASYRTLVWARSSTVWEASLRLGLRRFRGLGRFVYSFTPKPDGASAYGLPQNILT